MSVGSPPKAKGNKDLVQQRLLVVRAKSGVRESVTVEWRGHPRSIDVIDMPVEALYYNPETHRIRAQRSLDPEQDALLADSPWSEASQSYLHELLMGEPGDPLKTDPKFLELMEDLKEHGQRDPGIITPDGILVNGNTRKAALSELGQQNIRVGVLDEDWSWTDLSAVELSLQLRKDFKRDYSFLNYLLAVDEQLALGRSAEDVAKDFRQKAATIDRARWILAFIKDAINRSRVALDGEIASLRLIDFEGHQGKLEELYRTYSKLQSSDPNGAETLRESRLVALLVEKAKTDSRLIDESFFDTFLAPKLGTLGLSSPEKSLESMTIPGLDVAIEAPPASVSQARALADNVLQSLAVTRAGSDDTEVTRGADTLVNQVSDLMERSLNAAGRTSRLKKAQEAAPERLQSAVEEIKRCAAEVSAARASVGLDADALDDVAQELRDSLRALAEQVDRSVDEPGPGLQWLIAAATLEK